MRLSNTANLWGNYNSSSITLDYVLIGNFIILIEIKYFTWKTYLLTIKVLSKVSGKYKMRFFLYMIRDHHHKFLRNIFNILKINSANGYARVWNFVGKTIRSGIHSSTNVLITSSSRLCRSPCRMKIHILILWISIVVISIDITTCINSPQEYFADSLSHNKWGYH